MRRRVARVLRVGLGVLGLVLVGWLPMSWMYSLWLFSPWPGDQTILNCGDGVIWVNVATSPGMIRSLAFQVRRIEERDSLSAALWPRFFRVEDTSSPDFQYSSWGAIIPLWLLAFVCLAWPVTSFIVTRRRRRGRGFEVRGKADGAVSTSDS